ncbi:MAG: hypothetical protein ACR2NU_03640 [Aeoliella sp.]
MKNPFYLILCPLLALFLFANSPIVSADGEQQESAATATSSDSERETETVTDQTNGAEQEGEDTDEQSTEEEDDGDDAEEDDADADDDEDRETLKIKLKPLKIRFESDGVFVAREMAEVKLKPESWSDFEIEEIVPHGATVSKGEVVVQFDGKKLKEALDDLELDQRLGELAIIKSEQELPRLEESIQDMFEQAERSLNEAIEDYDNYQETDRDLMLKGIEMSLKSTQQYVESTREELRQLEKMYEADDLTEETEEIILKRQRAAVEQAEFSLKRAKISHDRNLNQLVPRNDIQEKETLDRVKLSFERAKTVFETDLSRARYELEKAKRSRTKSLEKHAKLTSDLGLLTLKAPEGGIVYYGKCTDGKWSDTASLIGSLKPEGTASTDSTLMTIVQPGPLYVISSVEEANRPSVELGQTASLQPTATDSPKLEATVSKLSSIPVDDGEFAMELDLQEDSQPEWLVAGMTGKAKVTTYSKLDAIVVPKKAVHSEEEDEEEKFVWIVVDDDVEKRSVTTGRTKGDDIEIVEGLQEGDVISLEEDEDDEEEEEDDEDEDEDDE